MAQLSHSLLFSTFGQLIKLRELAPGRELGGQDETSPAQILASGRGRCRAAGRFVRRVGGSLSGAAGPDPAIHFFAKKSLGEDGPPGQARRRRPWESPPAHPSGRNPNVC